MPWDRTEVKRSVTVVIPARYGSSRFPGKPLVELLGKPMIQHVYEQAQACRTVDDVLVATDDERIKTAVQRFGGQVVMMTEPVSYTHLRAHETVLDLVCRLLLEKKKKYKTD